MRLPALGVGIVWSPPFHPLCEAGEGLVSVVELEPEVFWVPEETAEGWRFRSSLPEALDGHTHPTLLHGVGAPLGGTCRPPPGHHAAFARDIARLRPAWISEHLSFSRFRTGAGDPGFAGFLLPPAQSSRGVIMAAENIRCRRTSLGFTAIAFETGVNYLPPLPGEMLDGEFAAAVADEADCGILLDLHNLLCNERNGRQSVATFCGSLPLDRVWELHLAGGMDLGGFRLDAHSGLVDAELMEIAAELVPHLPNLGAIVFEILPEFVPMVGLSAIAKQLERVHDLWARRQIAASVGVTVGGGHDRTQHSPNATPEPREWEGLLGCGVTGLPRPEPAGAVAAWWQAARPALDLYRTLAQEGRAGMLVPTASRTIHHLLHHRSSAGTRQLLGEFWACSPPNYTAVEEGRAFLRFIAGLGLDVDGLAEAIIEDQAALTRQGGSPSA
jgi:uncharacterized protein (UPF0276 family)